MSPSDTIIPAVSVALRRGDELLLVRRGREPAKGLHAFPGGRVEPGESLEQAARRELFEETGLVPGPLSVEGEFDLPGVDGAVYRLTVFRADHVGGDPVAGDDAEAAGWFGLEAMQGLRITASTLAMAGAILGAGESAKNSEE
jgi:ADP-ribose pyrophosphatase YjhB (NUDIX family)